MARPLTDTESVIAGIIWDRVRGGSPDSMPQETARRYSIRSPEAVARHLSLASRAQGGAGRLGVEGDMSAFVADVVGYLPRSEDGYVVDVLVPVLGAENEYRTVRVGARIDMTLGELYAEIESAAAGLSRRGTGELDTRNVSFVAVYAE